MPLFFIYKRKMQNNKVNLYQALAACMRGFFEAFAMGVIDDACSGDAEKQAAKMEPKNVKQAMLNYYGEVGNVFFDQMFYAIAQLTYNSVDEAVARVKTECSAEATVPDYMRVACREQAVYDAMLSEYKRNFGALLAGGLPSPKSHLADRVRGDVDAAADAGLCLRLLVRVVILSYVKGLRLSADGHHEMNQATLLRILAENINMLVHDSVITGDFETIDQLLTHVCGGEEAFAIMSEEMNVVMNDLYAE